MKTNLSSNGKQSGYPGRVRPVMNSKAQEEIMGFILIVIMVVVIGMAFLFFMTPRQQERTDLETENLLYSWLSTTVGGNSVENVIKNCESETCDMTEAIKALDTAASKSGLTNRINGYSLNISGTAEYYHAFPTANLTGNMRTAALPVSNSMVKLTVYYP